MKLSIFLFLFLFLTPHLVDSTNSDDENDQNNYFNRFQNQDVETSGTGTSGHGGTGTGSIPTNTGGYSQGMYSGTEHSQNLLDLNPGYGNNPFLNSPQHLQVNPLGQVPRNFCDLQLGYDYYRYQQQHNNPSGQDSSQNLLNLDLTLGRNQSVYPIQDQHMGAEYHQGTNFSGQDTSLNRSNLDLTLGRNQSVYPTQDQHMGAEYHQGTNFSGQDTSLNRSNLDLTLGMNSSCHTGKQSKKITLHRSI
uniref:Uncharacterized protein n=1 Tax=Meloidogyne enterolobii TaxID=390850 RepID=A0A6V7X7W9_MELEN|nr:unnamed protein product [Meloidogyne enterolobii]